MRAEREASGLKAEPDCRDEDEDQRSDVQFQSGTPGDGTSSLCCEDLCVIEPPTVCTAAWVRAKLYRRRRFAEADQGAVGAAFSYLGQCVSNSFATVWPAW